MSKIVRKIQKIFGSAAGINEIAQFGSLAASAPAFTTDPATIQNLSNYLTGWFGGVIGANSPAIEDMNALCFLFAYQLAYVMQAGTPEWESGTTYYKGSLANNGNGLVYTSLTDSNLNNAVTDTTKWRVVNGPGAASVVIGSAAFCTHATLAAAVADSAVGTSIDVLLTQSLTVSSSVTALTKAGWRIKALPGVSYTSPGAGAGGLSCQADGISIDGLRFVGFTTAITGTSSWTYGRVMNCNFNTCTSEVDTSSCVAGKIAITLGNFSEI